MAGSVYLVGAGPGDPGLITARGLACIRRSDVVVYDRLVCPALVAQCRPGAELVYVGKQVGQRGRTQGDINDLLVARALAGQTVCRLKGGDPFVFGRGGEEAEALTAHSIPFAAVPGVTSGVAAAAYAGIPVTHRDHSSSVTLVTGHESLPRGACTAGTLLIYMGAHALAATAERLIAAGRDPLTPAAAIQWGTTAAQATAVGTLETIANEVRAAGLGAPVMVVAGEVVALRERLAWAERRPLFGLRVLLPVTDREPSPLGDTLRDAGAEVWEWPVGTAEQPRTDLAPLLRSALPGAVALETPAQVAPLLAVAGDGLAACTIMCLDAATLAAAEAAGLHASLLDVPA